jgi:hypothetical protein
MSSVATVLIAPGWTQEAWHKWLETYNNSRQWRGDVTDVSFS